MDRMKTTTSLCPVCRVELKAEVVRSGETVELHKTCPQHGAFAATISSNARHYHLSIGNKDRAAVSPEPVGNFNGGALPIISEPNGDRCEADGDRGGCCESTIEHLSTCVALIEIVKSCNLSCPTCFADSPQQSNVDALDVDEIQHRIQRVLDRKGQLDILQLSGGEPTLHPDFFSVLEWCLAHDQIGHLLLNTNGIRLADNTFMKRLGILRAKYRKLEIYLQFDGPQLDGQLALRGADMRSVRSRVLVGCRQADIPVNLAMTVDRHNLGFLGETVRLALASPVVSGICWQPMFGSGRAYPGVNLPNVAVDAPNTAATTANLSGDIRRPLVERLSVADIIAAVVDQSEGLVSEDDFTPLPCGDPNCHTVAYLLRQNGTLVGLSKWIALNPLQGFLKDRLNYRLEDLSQCGCESEPLGQLLKQLEIGPESVFRLVIKPFMDVWTYDQHRVDRCCVHVIGPEGRLESFCRHYVMR